MKELSPIHSNRLRSNAVRITADGKSGSGILYQTKDSLFVVSVAHCLGDNRWINATIEYSYLDDYDMPKFRPLRRKGTLIAEYNVARGIDIAILEMEFPNDKERGRFEDVKFGIGNPTSGYHQTFGFPKNKIDGTSLSLKYLESGHWRVTDGMDDVQQGFEECMRAFSGSGIVDYDQDDRKVCWGIIRSLDKDGGTFRNVLACSPRNILRYLTHNSDAIAGTREVVADNMDYIPRYCSDSSILNIDYYFGPDRARYTLLDYVEGKAPCEASHFLLTGGAQTGKSYELRHLAHELGEKGRKVVFIKLSATFEPDEIPVTDDSVVILDAFDECGISNISSVAEKLCLFTAKYQGVPIVVSCRANFVEFLKNYDFKTLYLEDLSVEDVKEYIAKNGFLKPDEVVGMLRNSEIGAICTTPFNLKFVIQKIKENGGKYSLPASITQLYEQYVEDLFESEKDKSLVENRSSYVANLRLLKRMALVLMMSDRNSLSDMEMQKVIGKDEHLTFLKRNGVVLVDNNSWGFQNNTFKEFIASMALADRSLQDVKKLVCYAGTDKIKPGWYNALGFWIRLKSETDGSLTDDVIDWISHSSKNLLLYSDPTVISDDTRLQIVEKILNDCKATNSLYSMYYTGDFDRLYAFGCSKEFTRYLINELKSITEASSHLYNIMSLLACVDIETIKASKELQELIITKLNLIKDREHSFGMFFWMQSSDILSECPEILERVFLILKDNRHPDIISGICALIAKAHRADEYADYLYEAMSIIHDRAYHIVPSQYLNEALVSFHDKENIMRTLDMITKREYLRKEGEREENRQLLRQLLEKLLKEGWIEEFRKYRDIVFPEDINFVSCAHRRIWGIFNDLAEKYDVVDLAFHERMEKLLNSNKKTDEEEAEDNRRREAAFACLWDYVAFRKAVEKVADKCDENPGRYAYEFCFSDSIGYNHYVGDFFAQYGGWNSSDTSTVRKMIQDKDTYELFRFGRTISNLLHLVYKVEISDDKMYACIEIGQKLLNTLAVRKEDVGQDWDYYKLALEMMVNGMIEVGETMALALLPYGSESFSVSGCNSKVGDSKSVFDKIKEIVGADRLAEEIRQKLGTELLFGSAQALGPVEFLMNRGEKHDLDFLLDKVVEYGDSAFSYTTVQSLMEIDGYEESVMRRFSDFAPSVKIEVASQLDSDDRFASLIIKNLESGFSGFSDFERRRALRVLTQKGSLVALTTILDDKEEYLKEGEFLSFNYASPESLDYLMDLLVEFGSREYMYNSVINSLIVSLGNIASYSEKNLNLVIDRTEEVASKYGQLQFLRHSEEYFRNRYLQALEENASLDSILERIK